jgi:ABC-type iron transport system FetAB permease component
MYRKLLLENPPSTELGKKSYYAAKVRESGIIQSFIRVQLELLSNKLINSMDLERKSIEKELQLMDESVKSSKSYLRSSLQCQCLPDDE